MQYLRISIFIIVFIWSGINPKDRFTWTLEVIPVIIGVLVLLLTYSKFKFTELVYWLILIHCIVLMIGGHYTYAEVPYFKELFGGVRNNYDKLGHFMQGFVPALIAEEIILRKKIIRKKAWRNFFIICFCLAFSAFFELIEWWTALFAGEKAEAFLGTQGYVWDTQSDMLYALLGAIIALLSLSGIHEKQLKLEIRKRSILK